MRCASGSDHSARAAARPMGGTHFFIPTGGGEPLLWQHLFWFFGHPEVYIMILSGMGIARSRLHLSRKPILTARWPTRWRQLHFCRIGPSHVSVGMDPALGTGFMLTTISSGATAIKPSTGCTLYKGDHYTAAMLNGLAFVAMFVIGGLSGISWLHSVIWYITTLTSTVAHIHYVLFGAACSRCSAASPTVSEDVWTPDERDAG